MHQYFINNRSSLSHLNEQISKKEKKKLYAVATL